MSLPTLIKENERNDDEWKRKTRDAVNQLTKRTLGQGLTAERPRGAVSSTMFYDVTLKKPVWLDPDGIWRDAMGSAV